MLKDLTSLINGWVPLDPLDMSASPTFWTQGNIPTRYSKGMFESPWPFNGRYAIRLNDHSREYPKLGFVDAYGVCDTPEQFREKFGALLEADPRELCVLFSRVEKCPENRGKGGGWRWRKWGEYYGQFQPTTEYLDDEPGFPDGVYTFHVYVVDILPGTLA